ncbi:MAG: M28 family peptidase [Nitrospiraceae bacterium]
MNIPQIPLRQIRRAVLTVAAQALLMLCASQALYAQTQESSASPQTLTPSAARMLDDIRHLADPLLNGRQTGTADDLHSALWVADRFRDLGLQPAAPNALHAGVRNSWVSPIPTTVFSIGPHVTLATIARSAVTPHRVGTDFVPLLDSPSVDLTAGVTFVGYGISDPERGYDEYARVDVTDRVVLFLRGKPSGYEGAASHAQKIRWARAHGAVAALTVVGPHLSAYEARRGVGTTPLAYIGHAGNEMATAEHERLPAAWISVETADLLLKQGTHSDGAADAQSLADLQERLTTTHQPHSRVLTTEVRLQWDQRSSVGTLHNVVGWLPGQHSAGGTNDVIVVGAHRDHFGRQAGLLFPGADDNASGTAVMLEVARLLASAPTPLPRGVLFVSFSGEEQGLLGSTDYVRHPAFPLADTKAMVNIDHAGIGNGRLTIGVTGLPRELAARVAEAGGLGAQADLFGFFPGGDHVPFHEAKVPTVTIVSGGPHPHYHQATDTIETIQPDVLERIAHYVYALVVELARGHEGAAQ